MTGLTEYELEREANIARNRALLEQLDLKDVSSHLDLPAKPKVPPKATAKPVQPAKRIKRAEESVVPPRRSSRFRTAIDTNESPSKKRKREEEEEEQRKKEEEKRLEAEERAKIAKRPRHEDLDLSTLAAQVEALDVSRLRMMLDIVTQAVQARRVAGQGEFVFDDEKKIDAEVESLREKMSTLKVVSRAKVTQDRVYSAAYHPEVTKDLLFFGDKHGQLGIWDARASPDEVEDEDGDVTAPEDREGGKYWQLQLHWPATSKSSISSIKLDPIDSHSLYTSAYDCTIRSLSFTSGVSREIFSTDDTLISSIDLPPSGNEMWISDADGGLTHLDLRQDKSKAKWYGLSDQKIGCVSVNPTNPHFLLTASNNRSLKVWDTRRLGAIGNVEDQLEFENDTVQKFLASKKGSGALRGDWRHDKSVSSAYWDPRGRGIVSTCYDDTLRLWDIKPTMLSGSSSFSSFQPFKRVPHNCQTGKWLTILRAQWSPNPDAYPHFTIGNMKHSLDIFSCNGDPIVKLSDPKRISAVQAVTCSHPNIIERAASGNGSGRCVLWAPIDAL